MFVIILPFVHFWRFLLSSLFLLNVDADDSLLFLCGGWLFFDIVVLIIFIVVTIIIRQMMLLMLLMMWTSKHFDSRNGNIISIIVSLKFLLPIPGGRQNQVKDKVGS